MYRWSFAWIGMGLLGLALAGPPSVAQGSNHTLDPVFSWLHRYWGISRYSANFNRLFTGSRPKVNFIEPAAMLDLLASLCPKAKPDCIPHPESVLGKNVPDGRIFIVHGAVHPIYESLFIVHELEHQTDDPKRPSTVNEIRARSIEKDFLRKVLGSVWYDGTAAGLRARCLPMEIGSYVYRDPTPVAIQYLDQRFREAGIVLESNRHHSGLLRNSVMFIANEDDTLTHPYFVASFRAAP